VGWAPSLAAAAGALTLWFKERRLWWMLVPALVAYLAFMGLAQSRFFGRWLMPVIPIVCLLAAYFALESAGWLAALIRRSAATRARRPACAALTTVLVAVLLAQGLVYSIHSDLVDSRPYTINLARRWMIAHIPLGSPIVLEPIAPDEWVAASPQRIHLDATGELWNKYPSLLSVIAPSGALEPENSTVVNIEDYEKTLSPALIGYYESRGYCWVITGSSQFGRTRADPAAVPHAVAYYRALATEGRLVYHLSPYAPGQGPVAFNFDWTFDFYPLAYRLPGPEINIYRLDGGRCAKHPLTGAGA
jgi:hypothetical protein